VNLVGFYYKNVSRGTVLWMLKPVYLFYIFT